MMFDSASSLTDVAQPAMDASPTPSVEASTPPAQDAASTKPTPKPKPPARRSATCIPPLPPSFERYCAMRIYGGKDPTAVYGFIVDLPCRLRWARYYHEQLYEFDVLSLPTEEAAEELEVMEQLSHTIIPRMIYYEFPSLPRVQATLLPIDPEPGLTEVQYVFALRDNSSKESRTVRLLNSDIQRVRLRLGLGDQVPKWYEMYRE